jgi:uncharacterized protein DUF2017
VRAFRREGDELVAEVDAGEREVLATVVADVAELLGGGRLEDRAAREPDEAPALRLRLEALPTPDDPAVHRLLPDASRDDAAVSAEFRRLTEDDLRRQKTDRLAELYAMLVGDVTDDAEAVADADDPAAPGDAPAVTLRVPAARGGALAATLTDVRLVLGDRLGITDEESGEELERELLGVEPAPDDHAAQARQYLGSVYLALGWWQETLVAGLLADLPDGGARGDRSRPATD